MATQPPAAEVIYYPGDGRAMNYISQNSQILLAFPERKCCGLRGWIESPTLNVQNSVLSVPSARNLAATKLSLLSVEDCVKRHFSRARQGLRELTVLGICRAVVTPSGLPIRDHLHSPEFRDSPDLILLLSIHLQLPNLHPLYNLGEKKSFSNVTLGQTQYN